MTSAGSPGNRCCNEKISTDTKNSVGTSCTRRRARKLSMVHSAPRRHCEEAQPTKQSSPSLRPLDCFASLAVRVMASLKLQPDHADEPVGHLLVAVELGGVRDQDLGVIEI